MGMIELASEIDDISFHKQVRFEIGGEEKIR